MSNMKAFVEKITESPFVTFSRRPLELFDKTSFKIRYAVVCIVMAVGTLIQPFIVLIRTINSGYFNFGLRYVLAFILVWLAFTAACWLGFNLWWDKLRKSSEIGSSDFVAIPFFSEMIKTFGQWLGIMLSIIGGVGGLFALIFLGRYSGPMLATVFFNITPPAGFVGGYDMFDIAGWLAEVRSGWMLGFYGIIDIAFTVSVILGPVFGFLIVLVTRFWSERLRVLVAIADNTKKTSSNANQTEE